MIDDLISQALATAGPSRRDRVFAIAEVIHRHTGSLPSTKEAQKLAGKGSYTDVGHDLKDFRAIIAARTSHTATIPGLPRDLELKVGEVIAGLWQTTFERAQQEFSADREALDAQLAAAAAKLNESERERLQALEDRSVSLHRLAEIEKQLLAANDSVATEQRNVSERNITIQQLQTRIGEQETEMIRLQAEHDVELRALQAQLKERENRVLDLQSAAATIEAGYENQLAAARTLETEHRIRADKAETARQRIQESLEAAIGDLANLRGQFENMQSRIAAMEASRDQSISRIALLERDLESVTDKFSGAIEENTTLSHELTMSKAVIEERDARIRALEAAEQGDKQQS